MEHFDKLFNELNNNNAKIYVVGGFIRNIVYNEIHNTNIPIKDIDFLVSGIEEDKLMSLLKLYGGVTKAGLSFGVLIFKPNNSDEVFEIALPRKEISTGCEYKNFEIEIDPYLPIEKDLERRDFTINAMCDKVKCVNDMNNFNLGDVIDPFNGIEHIKNKICCCVNEPYERFKDDPTRIFRAFRISTQLDLNIEDRTIIGIADHRNLLNNLMPKSSVRLYNELFKIIKYENCLKSIRIMNDLDILKIIGIKTNIDTLNLISKSNIYLVKIMILLKNVSMENFDEWINYYQIPAVTGISKNDIISLKLSHNNEITELLLLVSNKYEMLVMLKKIGKYAKNNYNECVKYLIEYICADNLVKKDFLSDIFEECVGYPVLIEDIKITGNEITEISGKSGKDIGILKEKILDDIFKDNVINNNDELKRYIQQHIYLI